MLIRDYAQPLRLGYDMDAPCPVFGWPNTVVDARASFTSYPEHQGALSIKAVFTGYQSYQVGRARYAVTPERYLLLNRDQPHAHGVDEEAEIFILMFRQGLAEEVLSSLITPSERLLEGRHLRAEPTEFFERTYPRDPRLHTLLLQLRDEVRTGLDEDGLEQRFHGILERLLHIHLDVYREVERLPAVRGSTRVELYRRLHRAKDFMDACFTDSIDLTSIAGAAELSPHHLLRVFKQVFGVTPHAYLTERRLERAKTLLADGDRTVTDVCLDVGFESLGSFSRLFKRQVGVPPSSFRTSGA